MSKITKFVDEIADDPKKGIIWAVLLLLAGILLAYTWNKLSELFKNISNNVTSRLDNPVESGNLTHNKAWYKTAADTLFNAMDGAGTDEDAIFGVISQISNQDDWNELVYQYGTRTLGRTFSSDLVGTLQVHLRDDLNASEIKQIKNSLPNVNTGL